MCSRPKKTDCITDEDYLKEWRRYCASKGKELGGGSKRYACKTKTSKKCSPKKMSSLDDDYIVEKTYRPKKTVRVPEYTNPKKTVRVPEYTNPLVRPPKWQKVQIVDIPPKKTVRVPEYTPATQYKRKNIITDIKTGQTKSFAESREAIDIALHTSNPKELEKASELANEAKKNATTPEEEKGADIAQQTVLGVVGNVIGGIGNAVGGAVSGIKDFFLGAPQVELPNDNTGGYDEGSGLRFRFRGSRRKHRKSCCRR